MDVINENVECVETTAQQSVPPINPFPENEYKNGKLKKLRGRMVKKLLKYEFLAIAPVLGVMLGILAITTLFVCVLPEKLGDNFLLGVLPILLYIYSIMGAMMVSVIVPITRYQKTMFGEQGYLTLSIPATMEEHVFSKHLLAFCGVLVALIANILSLLLVATVKGGDFFGEISVSVGVRGVESVFAVIEIVFLVLLGCMALFTLSNAVNCFSQKFTKRVYSVWLGVGMYVLITVLSTVGGWMTSKGWFAFFDTPAGQHVGACIWIVLLAGLNVLCIWYQLWYLKKKINLK